MTDHAARQPDLEGWLDKRHIGWTFEPGLDINRIDAVAGLTNQTRTHALDDQAVDRYTTDLQDGAVFPAIVVHHHDGRLVPAGGNHRLAAHHAAGKTTIAAYITEPLDDLERRLLALEDNRRNGLPLTDPERIAHATALIRQNGLTEKDAARAVGISQQTLNRHLRADRFVDRCKQLNVTGYAHIAVGHRSRLDSLHDDRVFARAVGLACDGIITGKNMSQVVADLNRHPRPLDILNDLQREQRGRQPTRPGQPSKSPIAILIRDLDCIFRHQPSTVAAAITGPTEQARVEGQLRSAAMHLMKLSKTVKKVR